MRLRPVRPDDAAAIAAIYAHHVLDGVGTFEEVPPDAAEMAQRMADVEARRLPWLVAEAEGRIAGYAYAAPFRTRAAYRYTLEDSVYVAAGRERQGVGRALVAEVLGICARDGYRQMLAVIGDSGNAGSIGLHRSLGFVDAGVFRDVGFKAGRWLDVVMMQKTLS